MQLMFGVCVPALVRLDEKIAMPICTITPDLSYPGSHLWLSTIMRIRCHR